MILILGSRQGVWWLLVLVASGLGLGLMYKNGVFDAAPPPGPSPLAETARQAKPAPIVDSANLPYGAEETWRELDNPATDGWNVEAVADDVSKQWKQLSKLLHHPEELTDASLEPLVEDDFAGQFLVEAAQAPVVFQDPLFEVRGFETLETDPPVGSGQLPAAAVAALRPRIAGRLELARALAAEATAVGGSQGVSLAAKVIRVSRDGELANTRQIVALAGNTADARSEQHAVWDAQWQLQQNAPPRLLSLKLVQWTSARSQVTHPLMADCTQAILAGNESYLQQLQLGMNHWFEILQDTRYMSLFGNPGLAVGDVNGDGLEDLYVCQEWGLPNVLLLQQADGTAIEAARQWHVDWLENCRSALLVDLDNDGDQDLVAAGIGFLIVAANQSERFELRELLPCDEDTMSLAAADYDNDGDLDIYLTVNDANEAGSQDRAGAVAGVTNTMYFDATTGGRNRLYQNELQSAPWTFTDVTADTGLDEGNGRVSYAAAWEDFDNDGDQDLYVANDFGPNNLYRNDLAADGSRRFVDVAAQLGAEDRASGMSAAWADFDRDGQMDLYVGNMFSSAGQRVTNQESFKAEAPEVKAYIQRFARGNTLLKNQGGKFEDTSKLAGVTVGRWSWSSNFADLNNDGWEDLVVANGFITTDDTGDL